MRQNQTTWNSKETLTRPYFLCLLFDSILRKTFLNIAILKLLYFAKTRSPSVTTLALSQSSSISPHWRVKCSQKISLVATSLQLWLALGSSSWWYFCTATFYALTVSLFLLCCKGWEKEILKKNGLSLFCFVNSVQYSYHFPAQPIPSLGHFGGLVVLFLFLFSTTFSDRSSISGRSCCSSLALESGILTKDGYSSKEASLQKASGISSSASSFLIALVQDSSNSLSGLRELKFCSSRNLCLSVSALRLMRTGELAMMYAAVSSPRQSLQ